MQLTGGIYLGANRRRLDLGGLQLIDTVYHRPVFTGWHRHEPAHLTLMLCGGNLEKRRSGETTLTTGKIVFYRSQEEHCNDRTVFPSRNMNLEFSPRIFTAAGFTEDQVAAAVDRGRLGPLTVIRIMRAAEEPLQPVESTVMLLAIPVVWHRVPPTTPMIRTGTC
ncbi:MAG: hypothetical protein ACTHMI_02480 [Mucilaginibacter sp.]